MRSGLFPFHLVEGSDPVGISFVYLVLHDFDGGVNQPVLLGKGFFDHAGNLALPRKEPFQIRIIGGFGSLVQLCCNRHTGNLFCDLDQFQELLRLSRPFLPHSFKHRRRRFPIEEAVMNTIRVDLKIQAGVFCPPGYILADADPQTLLIGHGIMHSGIPVDAADFQKIAGTIHKWLEQFLSQCLHGFV